jgi:hypothetical protein
MRRTTTAALALAVLVALTPASLALADETAAPGPTASMTPSADVATETPSPTATETSTPEPTATTATPAIDQPQTASPTPSPSAGETTSSSATETPSPTASSSEPRFKAAATSVSGSARYGVTVSGDVYRVADDGGETYIGSFGVTTHSLAVTATGEVFAGSDTVASDGTAVLHHLGGEDIALSGMSAAAGGTILGASADPNGNIVLATAANTALTGTQQFWRVDPSKTSVDFGGNPTVSATQSAAYPPNNVELVFSRTGAMAYTATASTYAGADKANWLTAAQTVEGGVQVATQYTDLASVASGTVHLPGFALDSDGSWWASTNTSTLARSTRPVPRPS